MCTNVVSIASWNKNLLQRENTKNYRQLLNDLGYEIGRPFAKGSFSVVRYAISKKKGDPKKMKAVKEIDEEKIGRRTMRKFVRREIEIQLMLDHENIAKIDNVFLIGRKLFVVMDFIEGGDLMDFVEINEYLEEDVSKMIFKQITSALKYCHSQNIAHRDLKCENVLFDSKRLVAKLSDFGFARYLLDAKGKPVLSETFCGSLAYSSPEVLKLIKYDGKSSDIWSLGVLLFTMMNKKTPFRKRKAEELIVEQMQKQYEFSKKRPQISNTLQDLIKNMLRIKPRNRLTIEQVANHRWLQKHHKK